MTKFEIDRLYDELNNSNRRYLESLKMWRQKDKVACEKDRRIWFKWINLIFKDKQDRDREILDELRRLHDGR